MTLAVAIRTRLLEQPPLVALVEARVYVLVLPQGPTLPSARIQTIDMQEPYLLRGPVGLRRARMQVDSVAMTLADAEAVDAAVHGDGLGPTATGLAGWGGVVGSPGFEIEAVFPLDARAMFDAEERNQYVVSRDYVVVFRGE